MTKQKQKHTTKSGILRARRENWNGKYKTVIRNPKGHILTWKNWSRGDIGSAIVPSKALKSFKQYGTLEKGRKIERTVRRNVVEIVDTSPVLRKPRNNKYQVAVTISYKNVVVNGRSFLHEPSFPLSEAKNEAFENASSQLARELFNEYDADVGNAFVIDNEDDIIVSEAVVYYAKA